MNGDSTFDRLEKRAFAFDNWIEKYIMMNEYIKFRDKMKFNESLPLESCILTTKLWYFNICC